MVTSSVIASSSCTAFLDPHITPHPHAHTQYYIIELTTVEPRFNDLRYNDIPGITTNNRLPSKSYSKMYGAEPRYNDLRYNDIPGLTMGISLTEREIFLVITIKSISQTTGSANIVNIVYYYMADRFRVL